MYPCFKCSNIDSEKARTLILLFVSDSQKKDSSKGVSMTSIEVPTADSFYLKH